MLVVTNVYPTPERPFMSTFVMEQVESIRKYCHDVMIDVHVIEGYRPKTKYLREMVRLPSLVKKGMYDLVHAHFGLSLISVNLVSAPIIVTFHGSDLLKNPTKQISKLLARRASKVIVVSDCLREQLGYGEIIPCGIEVKDFLPPSHYRIKPRAISGSIRILFPSSPEIKIKGYGLFRDVCQELKRRGIKVEEVHLNNVDRKRVPEIYWSCDLMLLTSLSEGSPTVLKEAIAAKLPFICVDVGDVRQWARLVDFGVVINDRDPIAISDAVGRLLPKIKLRMGFDNSKCLEAMDIANIAHRIRHLYCEVLGIHSVKRDRVN